VHRRDSRCWSLFACLGSCLSAGAIAAETRSALVDEAGEMLGEVLVTGSRLPAASTDAIARVIVLTRHDLERGGANTIGTLLQALPVNTGSPRNTNVNTEGDGSVRVDLRGLGPERTLVLLNGRRFPNSGLGGDASVDLNTLPVSMIERIEVLASGASAVYGADAVGGVVNVITRQADEAMEVGGSWTITGHGDGEILRGHAALGFDLLEGAWSLGIDYTKQEGVTQDRRGYSAVPLLIVDANGTREFAGSGAIPEGRFGVPAGNALGLIPDSYTRVTGATGQSAADYRLFTQADRFNFAPFNYSQTPNERGSVWLLGSLPLSERSRLVLEALIHHRDSNQEQAPSPFFAHFGDGPTLADGTTGIPAANYYNPFGVDIRILGRRFVEQPARGFTQDLDLWRTLAAIEGAVRDWNWKLAVGKAETKTTNVETGLLLQSRLIAALGPSGPDDSGRIVCGPRDPATGRVPEDSIIPGCVPLNLFGGAGTITQEQLDYVSAPLVNSGTNEQEIAEAVVSGSWAQIRGRDLQWALGAEYRREGGSLEGDPLRAQGVAAGVAQDLPAGTFDARELFAEVQVPLFHDRDGWRELSLNVGARWSDFSSFDEHTSWRAGVRWRLAREVTLRANYSEVFRAPSLFELYQSRASVIAVGFDPCGNKPTAGQQVNCAANGVPGGEYEQQDELIGTFEGGNVDLAPETGRSIVAGVTWLPAWAAGISASVDLFDIELNDFIGHAKLGDVLLQCAERGAPEVCDTISRFPDGSVSRVSLEARNFGRVETRGADLAVDLRSATRLGDLSAGLLATYLAQWDEQPFPGGGTLHRAGHLRFGNLPRALPRWRAWGHIDWTHGPWMASYAAEYIGSFTECGDGGNRLLDTDCRPVEAIVFHDIEGGYRLPSGLALRAAITNVTDESPPFVNSGVDANTDVATYRLLGRTYVLGLRYAFQ